MEIKENFWHKSTKPLFMLAPMEDVTDTAFRELVMRMSSASKLHVLFTEFTSTDGLSHPIGRDKVNYRLHISNSERQLLKSMGIKIIAQVWGNKPEKFSKAVAYISEEYDFDGIDINMGCPVKNVVAHGSGAALINSEDLAGEIIAATREASKLPLSIKTRLGVGRVDTERWISFLLHQRPDALIIHGRIQKLMSEGSADWAEIAKAVSLRDELAPDIIIIGNGDIESLKDAMNKTLFYKTDGAMIGRGIFKNPWLFNTDKSKIGIKERLDTMRLHLRLFHDAWGESRNFHLLRRFFKIYLSDFPGALNLRNEAMKAESFDEAIKIIDSFEAVQLLVNQE